MKYNLAPQFIGGYCCKNLAPQFIGGCCFKNPPQFSPAVVLTKAGIKGFIRQIPPGKKPCFSFHFNNIISLKQERIILSCRGNQYRILGDHNMEENDTKVCEMCYKEIPDKAKKCPYCHHWQSKISMIIYHPIVSVLIFIIPLALMMYLFTSMLDRGEDFKPYRDKITINDSELKFGEKKVCDKVFETVAVIGTMSNSSSIPWKDIQIEVRFYDSNGKMIDSEQKKDYPFEVPAHGNAAFKISTQREFPIEQYVSYKITIISARDARSRW
jgi:hypothetical protein